MGRQLFILFIIIGFMSPMALCAEEVALTLDEAVAIGLRDNRDILIKSEDVEKAKLKIREAESGLFPTLNLTAGLNKTRQFYSKDISQLTTQATLKQYLYKGGKTINTIKYNGYNFDIAQSILDKTKLETVLSIKKAFYTLLLSRELVSLNKGIVDNTYQHLDSIKERYKKGEASESEVLKIQASLSNVMKGYEESVNQFEAARELLNTILYLDKNTKINPEESFLYVPKEVAYDNAFLKAMETRPEIRQYIAEEKAKQSSIEIAKSDNRPSIYASWDYYSRSHASAGTTKNWSDYNIIGLTFSWPIFDGWATKSKVEEAIIDLKQTVLLKEKASRDISFELKNAYLSLKNAITKIQASQQDIKVYQDNFSVVKQQYEQGIASNLDVNDATVKYDISVFNKYQTIYEYVIAKASFDKATGGF